MINVQSNLVVHKGVTNRTPDHLTKMNYKLQMNTIEYMFEVNVEMNETHSPRIIRRTGIQYRIPTSNLLKK